VALTFPFDPRTVVLEAFPLGPFTVVFFIVALLPRGPVTVVLERFTRYLPIAEP
jgi:hypothetical protein